jgi:hypothetical protein
MRTIKQQQNLYAGHGNGLTAAKCRPWTRVATEKQRYYYAGYTFIYTCHAVIARRQLATMLVMQ